MGEMMAVHWAAHLVEEMVDPKRDLVDVRLPQGVT